MGIMQQLNGIARILVGLVIGMLLMEYELLPDPTRLDEDATNSFVPSSSFYSVVPNPHSHQQQHRMHRHHHRAMAASHVLDRDSAGLWTPRLFAIQENHTSIDRLLFPSPYGRIQTKMVDQYLGVVRITKTGSTSLLQFMDASSTVQTFNNYMDMDLYAERLAKPTNNPNYVLSIPACFFGAHGSIHKAPIVVPLVAAGVPVPNQTDTLQCNHDWYARQVYHWTKSLRFLQGNPMQPLQVAMDMITILRDPFDRYVSFFHYWRQIYPNWAITLESNSSSYKALIQGDLETFVRSIAQQPTRRINAMFQYEYLAMDSELRQQQQQQQQQQHTGKSSSQRERERERERRLVDVAIAMVQQLRVLPLLNECFDASIYLLSARYPDFFPIKTTVKFLQSQKAYSNRSEQRNRTKFLHPHLQPLLVVETQQQQQLDMDRLRKLARDEWLTDEYRFYDASVQVFRRLLQETNFHNALGGDAILLPVRVAIQTCLEKLVQEPTAATTTPPPHPKE